MIIVTSENVAGYRITETKGQVFGLVVRSRGIGG
ncbi:MAG: heavy metal-binding domain-containing protein, partial [Rhodanobacteraceae bacterium]